MFAVEESRGGKLWVGTQAGLDEFDPTTGRFRHVVLATGGEFVMALLRGRDGSFRTGLYGAVWIDGLGWMTMAEFLRKQGVVEASNLAIDNPIALDAKGTTISAGIAGVSMTWIIDADQVYVCSKGKSTLTGFPNGLRDAVATGAKFGRCEFQ